MSHGFPIPPELQTELEPIEVTDTRSNEDILSALREHVPVTSEKNIWTYWHAGLDAMPAWCQRNIIDWVRICGPAWTVRVLDTVPGSANHAFKFAPKELLPEAFVTGTLDGAHTGQHSADFLRGALLYTHGGVNMDVGIFLIRHIDRICWSQLEDPASPYTIAAPLMYGQLIANHFVAARKGDPFIKRWHNLFMHLWKDRTNSKGLSDEPLISFVKAFQYSDTEAHNYDFPFKVSPIEIMEYITQVGCWIRLCMLEGTGSGGDDDFNGSEYWQTHVLCPHTLEENWGIEAIIGFSGGGSIVYDVLTTRLDADPESPEFKKASEIVWKLLTKCSLQKVSHAKNLTFEPALGIMLDENPEADCAPGTFAELLRYGSVHFRQKREEIVTLKPEKAEMTFKKGLLEL